MNNTEVVGNWPCLLHHSVETVLHHFVEDYQGGGEGVIGTAGKTKEQVSSNQ